MTGTNLPNLAIEDFEENFNKNEMILFMCIEGKFELMLDPKLNAAQEQMYLEKLEKVELEPETNRLRRLLVNVKGGSMEVAGLCTELDVIRKKEVENSCLYFEKEMHQLGEIVRFTLHYMRCYFKPF